MPANTAAVIVRGQEFTIGFDITEPEEAVHYQHGTIPACGPRCIATDVLFGTEWQTLGDVFSSDFMDEIDAELNRMPSND